MRLFISAVDKQYNSTKWQYIQTPFDFLSSVMTVIAAGSERRLFACQWIESNLFTPTMAHSALQCTGLHTYAKLPTPDLTSPCVDVCSLAWWIYDIHKLSYMFHRLAWKPLRVPQEELDQVAGRGKSCGSLFKLPPLQPDTRLAE